MSCVLYSCRALPKGELKMSDWTPSKDGKSAQLMAAQKLQVRTQLILRCIEEIGEKEA